MLATIVLLLAEATPLLQAAQPRLVGESGEPPRQVRWMVDAGRAKDGVARWAAGVVSRGAMTGLVGCCGRFHIGANGTWFDEWPEATFPLQNWDFAHELGLTMHFVFTVDQQVRYASRAVQFHPHGGQSDFVWLPARTPRGGASYVW